MAARFCPILGGPSRKEPDWNAPVERSQDRVTFVRALPIRHLDTESRASGGLTGGLV